MVKPCPQWLIELFRLSCMAKQLPFEHGHSASSWCFSMFGQGYFTNGKLSLWEVALRVSVSPREFYSSWTFQWWTLGSAGHAKEASLDLEEREVWKQEWQLISRRGGKLPLIALNQRTVRTELVFSESLWSLLFSHSKGTFPKFHLRLLSLPPVLSGTNNCWAEDEVTDEGWVIQGNDSYRI